MQAVFWLQIQGDGQGTGLFPGAWGFMDNSRLSRIRLSVQIGLRYAGAFGANRFASFVSLFSAIGIMLGVAALIIVTSVMGGLENRLKNSVLSVVPHAVIESASGPVKEDPGLLRAVSSYPLVRAAAPYTRGEAVIAGAGGVTGAELSGIDPETYPKKDLLYRYLTRYEPGCLADWKDMPWGVILGASLARSLGVYPGDRVRIISPEGARYTMAGLVPSSRLFSVVCTFQIGSNVDGSTAIVRMSDAGRLMRLPAGSFSGYRVWLKDPFDVSEFSPELPAGYKVSDWRTEKGELFSAVSTEKRMMTVMLFLIIFVAAFNILSSLIMMVMDKRTEIAILRTMGFRPSDVMLAFMTEGAVAGIIGALIGTLIGTACAYHINPIMRALGLSSLVRIGSLPVSVSAGSVVLTALGAVCLSLLSTLYPSYRASRVMPAEVLRYE